MGTASGRASESPAWGEAAQAMYRAAQAAAHPGGPSLMGDLVHAMAEILGAATAFVAIFSDESHHVMHTLAAVLDGKTLQNFDYPLAGTPCEQVVGRGFRYVAQGVAGEFRPDTLFAAKGMDAYAAFPLNDRDGRPLGLLVAMDRGPIADAALAEALLKIFAGRIAAELERERADGELRAAALAVSHARGESVFSELARYLATVLHVEVAFISRQDRKDKDMLRMLALHCDGQNCPELASYRPQGTPCGEVYGRRFRAWPSGLREHFPEDPEALLLGAESYAGVPLNDSAGAPLGVIAVASRRPLTQLDRVESMLQIFAVRAAAELEQLRANEALRRSEASYRAIFETAEDAIFVHDWDSGAILDANPKACANYGYSRDELLRLTVGDLSSGVPPYTQQQALHYLGLAKLDRCPPFEWQRRSRDGRLGWDEVRLKPLQIDGRPHILAITREITHYKAALAALQAREEQYRVIFDGSADALVLWDQDIRCVDVNPAFTRLFGYERAEAIGGTFPRRFGDEAIRQRLECMRAALQGQERSLETQAVRKDGSRFDVEVRYLPIRYGGVPHVLSIGRDITARNAALAALQASEQQYRAIFDGSADSMGLWNEELRLVDVNQAFTRLSGWTREDVIGRPLSAREGEPEVAQRTALIRGALAGVEGRIEACVPGKGGLRFEVEVRYVPVRFGGVSYALSVARDITERNTALRALRAQEQKYRAIFDSTVDSMVLWDRQLRVVDVNEAFVQMTRMPREQVIGRHWSERPDAGDMPKLLGFIEAALQGRVVQSMENVMRGDGSRFEIELRYLPVRFGDEVYALGVGRDVSDRLERERRLRDSEAQYRAIFNASTDALVLRDADFRIVDVNATYERMSGWHRDQVLGADRNFANPAEIAPAIRAQHERAIAGEPFEMEVPLLRQDGERYEIELRGVPILHRGQPHVLYMGRDVTERKRAEQALRDSEAQYRAIFNASADALILWNSAYRRVDVNPAYERIFGWSRADVVGHGVEGPNPDDDSAHPRRELVRRALAGEACSAERAALRKDGTRILTEVHAIPFQHQGAPHVLAIARDITERRAAEAERERLEAQLRQAQKMEAIGQLTGGIAHDFNNILTSVIGYLVLGQERAERLADAALQRQLGQAQLAAQRARELIAQMLAFARRQRGQRQSLAVAPLVQQTLQLLRATLPSSVTVDFQPPADGAEALQVLADPVQLEQVLFNLCINARDAIDGPGRIRVRLGRSGGGWSCASCRLHVPHVPEGRWVEVGVADSGSGIAPEVLERMFEPFYTTKQVGQGSGMGLAMVHGIVHDHGGHVAVQTRPGEGARFRVLLPAATTAPAGAEAASGLSDRPAARPLAGRVMVVDDEAMVGDFMAELLGGWGLDVLLQRDPRAALDWLVSDGATLDLLITDQTMPGMSGLVLAQRARAARPGLPVLLYSGHADAIDAADCERSGIRAVLPKPLDAEALRMLLQRVLAAGG